ncbi:Hypothetical protein NTJ_13540 [Nesidiocoris tenuis]|uniref:Uncharacterized protein n=1 Tax=Nesidiocoris tenuis TaxID=355587 RepID=A0ABN7B8L0_9HEMI|nr:Hypothetical protein NTJ_13540 [Nesidiocoris tenuis]
MLHCREWRWQLQVLNIYVHGKPPPNLPFSKRDAGQISLSNGEELTEELALEEVTEELALELFPIESGP